MLKYWPMTDNYPNLVKTTKPIEQLGFSVAIGGRGEPLEEFVIGSDG